MSRAPGSLVRGIGRNESARPLRSDAERNRRLILETADRMLAQQGAAITLNEIAREAGIGIGTVYRRFPDMQSLFDALFTERFTIYLQFASTASQAAEPGRALTHYLLAAATWRAKDPGLDTILANASLSRPEIAEIRDELGRRIDSLVEEAVTAGAVRDDFASTDVYSVLYMLGAVADRTESLSPGAWRRYAVVLLTGFGLHTDSAELTEAMTDEQILQAWPTRT
jgi:AcrR family transcriptional regulator